MRDTASIDVPIKKDPMEVTNNTPEDEVVAANEQLARQKLNYSSEIGPEQINEFASSEGEEEVPEEPPEEENKTGGTRTDAENFAVLFLLLYNCAVMVRDFMEMKQQQRDLVRMWIKTKILQLNAYDQIQDSSMYNVEESCTEENLRVDKADTGFEFVSKRVAVSNSSAREMVELKGCDVM